MTIQVLQQFSQFSMLKITNIILKLQLLPWLPQIFCLSPDENMSFV